jgi:hypothetical protein
VDRDGAQRYDNRMLPVSNYDVLVIVAVSGALQIVGLVILGVLLLRQSGMIAECQRLTRAVAGLVIQEEEKTRSLLRP